MEERGDKHSRNKPLEITCAMCTKPVIGGSELSENDFREQKYRDEEVEKAYRNIYRIWKTIINIKN